MSDTSGPAISDTVPDDAEKKVRWAAAGGLLGAIAASSCCVLPLVLFSLGIGGAWIGKLAALAPYQPVFIAVALACLGAGYWLAHGKSRPVCADGTACVRPLSGLLVRSVLWLATALVGLALAWPYMVPLLLG